MLNIPFNSLLLMLSVAALLLFASAVCWFKGCHKKTSPSHELWLRTRSWWLMCAVVFAALSINQTSALLLFGFLSFMALKEFISIVPVRLTDRRALFWAYIAIPFQYLWVAQGWYGMFIIFIPVYLFLFLAARLVLLGETKGFIRSAGVIHWALMLTVFSISHIAYLLVLPVKNSDAGAIGLVLYLIVLTQFNDVAQFCWGKTVGKRPIAPKVSPNKTQAGFWGGLVTTTIIGALLAPQLTPLTIPQGLLAAAMIAITGFFGDLVLSAVKRDLQIKDCSQLIPGHGGLLDRLDSLMFSAPVFFHLTYYLHY